MKPSLLDFDAITTSTINEILNRALFFAEKIRNNTPINRTHQEKTVANLFYEPSTRTHNSFHIAQQKLGLNILNPFMNNLSHCKGESLLDTLSTFEQMGVDLFVIRHHDSFTPHFIANEIATPIINAGDGTNHHPTQALIDLLTIKQKHNDLKDIKIAIIGDVKHSRVAHSAISLFSKMGANEINLICPPELSPTSCPENTKIFHDLKEGLDSCDVILALRIQTERIQDSKFIDKKNFHTDYGLTQKTIKYAKKDVVILHPGPINRGIEMDSQVADSPMSKIKQQVYNSVPTRMAIIEHILQT